MATSTTTPTFQHGKNAFLALGYDMGLTAGNLVQATATASFATPTATLTIAGAGTGTLLTQNNAMTPSGAGNSIYGAFFGGVPVYGTALSTSSMTVTSQNVATTTVATNVTPMVNISQYINDASLPFAIEAAETTAFSQAGVKTYIVGLKSWTLTFSGMFDETAISTGYAGGIDAIMYALSSWQDSGRIGNFVYGPATPGGFTGLTADTKYYGTGVLTKYDLKSAVGAIVTFDGEMQVTGPVYRTTL